MLSSLPPREREIVDLLYQNGALTVGDIGAALPGKLSGSAIRAMLQRLERKGFVERSQSERGFLYSPSLSEKTVRKSALGQVVRVFFNGSASSAAAALLGMDENLDDAELDALEDLIARARKEKDV